MERINSKDIRDLHKKFSDERNWDQFHSVKNLTMALSVETSELVEIFQWLTEKESNQISKNSKQYLQAKDELADILIYLLRIADKLDIDLNEACFDKMKKNAEKYPIAKAMNNSSKYTDFID